MTTHTTHDTLATLGETLAGQLEIHGVSVVFGIPGVHTVELYRGLAASALRHVTARHEQGAGFMADGYARVAGVPGVVLVITGPGLTNVLTPMAQARADSVPMVVVSAANPPGSRGAGLGLLHELPDQLAMVGCLALSAREVGDEVELSAALVEAFDATAPRRPGPRHVQVPHDVARRAVRFEKVVPGTTLPARKAPDPSLSTASDHDPFCAVDFWSRVATAERRVLLCGGGARGADAQVRALAEALGAPVVLTTNARGLMHAHPLCVPASPSLPAVRELLAAADLVIALGTELGATDYDMFGDASAPEFARLIRVDLCDRQLARHPAELVVQADAARTVRGWLSEQSGHRPDPQIEAARDASARAAAAGARESAWNGLDEDMRRGTRMLDAIRRSVPGAIIVGDSTQLVYAGNLYYDHDLPGGWFNAATGYGALGYAIPAAIGASIAAPESIVVCVTGDGGAQFSLPELMSARDERVRVIFVVWNNHGYLEIERSMQAAGVSVVGCSPSPPRFDAIAQACDLPYFCCAATPEALSATLDEALTALCGAGDHPGGPVLIEIDASEPASPNEGKDR